MHDIIGTHVCHHLVSTIPFYHAGEASAAIRKVMGKHYRADRATPFMAAFWRNQRACRFVEETIQGSGVYFFRNLHGDGVAPKDLTGGKAEAEAEASSKGAESGVASGAVSMPGSADAKRRFSHSAARALPILAE